MTRLFIACIALVPMEMLVAATPEPQAGMARDMRVQTWPAVEPVAIGQEPQLFIDNYLDRRTQRA